MEQLPHVNGKSILAMVVNGFSKYTHFFLTAHACTTSNAHKFSTKVAHLNGIPETSVTDGDPVVMIKF